MDCCSFGFNEILKVISEKGINSDTKLFMSVLFPKQFVDRSLNLLNKEKMTCYIAKESRRTFWKIETDKSQYYSFAGSVMYCSCPSFQRDVIKEGKYPMCKHCLAIEICNALQKGEKLQTDNVFKLEIIDDRKFADEIIRVANETNLGLK